MTLGDIVEKIKRAKTVSGVKAAVNALFDEYPDEPDGLRSGEYRKLKADIRGLIVELSGALTAQEYMDSLGQMPWTNEQCKELRKRMEEELCDPHEITVLVGDGSRPPQGIMHFPDPFETVYSDPVQVVAVIRTGSVCLFEEQIGEYRYTAQGRTLEELTEILKKVRK